MDLALDKIVNPAVPAHVDVVMMWLASQWNCLLPRCFLDEALSWAIANVSLDTHWDDLRGPASALVATLLRLGWSFMSPSFWVTPGGHTVDVDHTSPRD
eukprot:8940325-Pyramimonas_sp.AAC.1